MVPVPFPSQSRSPHWSVTGGVRHLFPGGWCHLLDWAWMPTSLDIQYGPLPVQADSRDALGPRVRLGPSCTLPSAQVTLPQSSSSQRPSVMAVREPDPQLGLLQASAGAWLDLLCPHGTPGLTTRGPISQRPSWSPYHHHLFSEDVFILQRVAQRSPIPLQVAMTSSAGPG